MCVLYAHISHKYSTPIDKYVCVWYFPAPKTLRRCISRSLAYNPSTCETGFWHVLHAMQIQYPLFSVWVRLFFIPSFVLGIPKEHRFLFWFWIYPTGCWWLEQATFFQLSMTVLLLNFAGKKVSLCEGENVQNWPTRRRCRARGKRHHLIFLPELTPLFFISAHISESFSLSVNVVHFNWLALISKRFKSLKNTIHTAQTYSWLSLSTGR